ncbi:MAG: hypothetical protein JNL32_04685 [Candidatus Kapabacteria bacterium]|nr:hypothetical protein [Candidatus Kapabacteria bacterium]
MKHLILCTMFVAAALSHAQTTTDSTTVRRDTTVRTVPPVVTPTPAPAQQVFNPDQMNRDAYFGVGAQLGASTGGGISMRYTMPNRIGTELTFWYLTLGSDRAMYNIGAEFQYKLDNSADSRVYAIGGVGYYGESLTKDSVSNSNTLTGPFRFGVGLGYEWSISRAAMINVEGVLTIFSDKTVLPLPQMGFVYYFR